MERASTGFLVGLRKRFAKMASARPVVSRIEEELMKPHRLSDPVLRIAKQEEAFEIEAAMASSSTFHMYMWDQSRVLSLIPDLVEHKEIEMSKEVQQVSLNWYLKNVDRVLLSAREALYKFSDLTLYKSRPSAKSRFAEVVELMRQQVFLIKCTIKTQILSPDTTYGCYLVYKLSEECKGFHCLVEVRDLLNRGNKEAEIVYFKTPSPWNVHDIFTQVPQQREDGWMELNVWKANSDHGLKNDLLHALPRPQLFYSFDPYSSGPCLGGQSLG
uniref:F-box protein PP2-B13-like n=1 Tax=Erigeron canadensis TaxID=72917 RepID=UPI001CB92338|nr:F-box protein PP2-B13-like [Erigeron canadensis]